MLKKYTVWQYQYKSDHSRRFSNQIWFLIAQNVDLVPYVRLPLVRALLLNILAHIISENPKSKSGQINSPSVYIPQYYHWSLSAQWWYWSVSGLAFTTHKTLPSVADCLNTVNILILFWKTWGFGDLWENLGLNEIRPWGFGDLGGRPQNLGILKKSSKSGAPRRCCRT